MINLFIWLSVAFWASSFVGIRAASNGFSPIEIAVLRFIVSSIALILIKVFKKTILPQKGDFFRFIQLGFVLFLNHISLNYGIRTITAGETTLIVSTSQIFQVLLAYFFLKETISNRFMVGLSFCFLGVSIIAFQKSIMMSFNLGVLLVLIASVTNAAFFILQKPLLKKYNPLEVVSYSTFIATLLLLPFGGSALKNIPNAGLGSILSVIYIGVVSVIAHICWSKVLSKIDASKAAMFLCAVPVMTIITGFLWLQELPSLISCMGGVIIIWGVILSVSNSPGREYIY